MQFSAWQRYYTKIHLVRLLFILPPPPWEGSFIGEREGEEGREGGRQRDLVFQKWQESLFCFTFLETASYCVALGSLELPT